VFIRPGLWFPGCRLGTNLAVKPETLRDGSASRVPERRRSSLPLPKDGPAV